MLVDKAIPAKPRNCISTKFRIIFRIKLKRPSIIRIDVFFNVK